MGPCQSLFTSLDCNAEFNIYSIRGEGELPSHCDPRRTTIMATGTSSPLVCPSLGVEATVDGGATISQVAVVTVSVICGLILLALLFALLVIFTRDLQMGKKSVYIEEPLNEYGQRRRRTRRKSNVDRTGNVEEMGVRDMAVFGMQRTRSDGLDRGFSRARADGPIYGRGPIPAGFRGFDIGAQGGVTRHFTDTPQPIVKSRPVSEREKEDGPLNDVTDASTEDGRERMRQASRSSRSQQQRGERV